MKPIPQTKQQASRLTQWCMVLVVALLASTTTLQAQSEKNNACIECHADTVKDKVIHGPTVTDCKSCHVPNGQEHPLKGTIGFKMFDKGSELCYTCHVDNRASFKMKYIHKPLKKDDCVGCHDPHSANNQKLLKLTTPALCVSCHKDFAGVQESATSVHTASFEAEACLTCHNPHASKIKRLLVAKSKDLCLNCHNKTIKKPDGKIIANIGKHLDENDHKHKALKKRCTGCHDPHFSKDLTILLKYKYPVKNYTVAMEESYELCFRCHDTDLLMLEKTTTGTEFRNGDQNLHFLHINKTKGRTCMNCHDVHAASNTKLIAKTVKFGRWDMPLNYIDTEVGGSCATGCHKREEYKRGDLLKQ